MKLSRRRRGRPRGTPRLRSVGDTQAAEDARQWLSQLETDPADGTTVIFEGASDIGQPVPPWRPDGERFADPRTWRNHKPLPGVMSAPAGQPGADTEPITRARPAAILPMPQARAVMKVYPPGPGVPAPTPQALEVARFLRAKVAILRMRGHLDRITDEKLRLVPGDRATNRRTTARLIVDEAAELLRCGGDPR
jgi:hypothetical protein